MNIDSWQRRPEEEEKEGAEDEQSVSQAIQASVGCKLDPLRGTCLKWDVMPPSWAGSCPRFGRRQATAPISTGRS
jgi:hypothetical protein